MHRTLPNPKESKRSNRDAISMNEQSPYLAASAIDLHNRDYPNHIFPTRGNGVTIQSVRIT